MICQNFREIEKRFRRNHKYLITAICHGDDQDITFQKNPEALFLYNY